MKMVVMRQSDAKSEWMGLQGEQVLVQKKDLEDLLSRSKMLIEAMMPGVRYIALQNYAELNDVQVELQRALLQLKGP